MGNKNLIIVWLAHYNGVQQPTVQFLLVVFCRVWDRPLTTLAPMPSSVIEGYSTLYPLT
jgi:hypothetical protein